LPFLAYSSRQQRARWQEASDLQLIEAIQVDNEEAFDVLIQRKAGPLVNLVGRIVGDTEEARDIVQVAFVRVWENRLRFNRRWSPNTWIYRIAANLAIDHRRSRQTRERAVHPGGGLLRRVETDPLRTLVDLEEREVSTIFDRLSGVLTEKQRTVFLLRGIEGMSSREVGEILGCRASTVRNHLLAARRKLREELNRLYPEYAPKRTPTVDQDRTDG
jgi:RNA polymerase sigma-70 factor (ECF subfamily)